MAIIRYTKDATIRYAYLNIFPDQFKTEKEKQEEGWVKNTMDYFANKAYSEYVKNRNTFESINIIKYPRIPKFQDSFIVAEKKRLDVTVYHLR